MIQWDPEALERGYRYFKALEYQRRGYVCIRELIADELLQRRWDLRTPEQIAEAALVITDRLFSAGALAVYQAGVNEENWRDHEARQARRGAAERDAELRRATNEARDEEQRRVNARIAELDAERERERYAEYLRRELARAEEEQTTPIMRALTLKARIPRR